MTSSFAPQQRLHGEDLRKGLTASQAAQRLVADGLNLLPQTDRRTTLRIALEVSREPMFALLMAGGAIYAVLGDLIEALILLGFGSFSIAVTVLQETRTEHVLEALRDLSAPRALVIRDGAMQRIAGAEVVRGDVLVLEAGDRVAADAHLLEAADLSADEALLTGESLPVGKQVVADHDEATAAMRPGGEGQSVIYSGSLITRGHGLARVVATGARTEIGRIGTSLASIDPEPARLRRETARIVRLSAAGGALVALLVVVLFGLARGSWIEAILAGITTAMTLLPEEFTVVLTVFMAMGAWRIGQARVLTRRAAAIETLGATTVLCTDKTGTLTENRMALVRLWAASTGEVRLPLSRDDLPTSSRLVEFAMLASPPKAADPMEIAILEGAQQVGVRRAPDLVLDHTYGLRPELLAMANIWRGRKGSAPVLAAKGAPEAIATLCGLDEAACTQMTAAVDRMAGEGIRVLGVASCTLPADDQRGALDDYDLTFEGLIGLADPLRAAVPDAIAQCRSAGIRVAMITGDYTVTASAIAAAAGIADGEVLTGADLEAFSSGELAHRLSQVSVFARIMPEQKLRIVEAFKAAGEIVAMTGDGVNDAPSLKAAHIGIAMGNRGTDVAREASAIVLLDDDFAAIVKTIALGRRIYDNIRKAMAFIIAVHVPIAGLTLLPLLLGKPLLFGPIHIALLEMVIDPVCALVFEAEPGEDDIMRRKPRDPGAAMFSIPMIGWSMFQGSLALALLVAVYVSAMHMGLAEAHLRGLMFFSLVAATFALILVNRSFGASLIRAVGSGNLALIGVIAAVAAVTAAILAIAPVRSFMRFDVLHVADGAIAVGIGITVLFSLELVKPRVARALGIRERADSLRPDVAGRH